MSERRTVFHPDRMHVVAIIILSLIAIIPVSSAPLLAIFYLIPLLWLVVIFRSRTEVTAQGIKATYALSPSRSVTWEELKGIRTKNGRVYAHYSDQDSFRLPGISYNTLALLAEASEGRIPTIDNEVHAHPNNSAS